MSTGEQIRLRFVVHYDGSGYFGWQVQPEVRTVQGELQAAATRLTGGERTVIGSGRTDRGVHALGQVAAVDLPARWTADAFRKAMNAVLPADVWLADAEPSAPDFHPRYDAVERTYEYRLGLAEESRSPFHRHHCWPLAEELDRALLRRLAGRIPGERSFRSFAKAGQPERGERCRVVEAVWESWAPLGVVFRISADRYLHHMVRYLVGTMVDVARGRRPPGEFDALLDGGGDSLTTSAPAPPQGLFLSRVHYPGDSPPGPPPTDLLLRANTRT